MNRKARATRRGTNVVVRLAVVGLTGIGQGRKKQKAVQRQREIEFALAGL